MASFIAPLAISGLSALAGGLLNQNKKQTQSTTQNQAGDQSASNINRPIYDPAEDQLRYNLLSRYFDSLGEDPNLSGYEAQGLSKINQNADIRTRAIQNSLAARGFSNSPISAYAPAMSNSARISDASQFQNSLPLLRRSLYDERLKNASGFLQSLPKGTYGTQDSTFHSGSQGYTEGTIPGNPTGGAVGGLATTLAGLYGQGAFSQTPKFGVNSMTPYK